MPEAARTEPGYLFFDPLRLVLLRPPFFEPFFDPFRIAIRCPPPELALRSPKLEATIPTQIQRVNDSAGELRAIIAVEISRKRSLECAAAMRQLSLFPSETAPRSEPRLATLVEDAPATRVQLVPHGASVVLAARLSSLLREPVEVELTDNAWTMLSYRRVEGRLHFRLHHMFARAHEPVMRALAGFTGTNRRAHGRAIDEYVRQHRELIRKALPRAQAPLSPRGRVHDLGEIYSALNARHFENSIRARIGWGRRSSGGRRRSIKMGVYFHDHRIIRIHPALDDARVPGHFVEMVVFHEMLHQIFPPSVGGDGRRTVHGPEFRAAERRFPGYERARAWERAHLHLLLRQRS